MRKFTNSPIHQFTNSAVEAVFSTFSEPSKSYLFKIREIILSTADDLALPGGVEETLKWGEPSYLPKKPRLGSTVRIGKFDEFNVGLYFNCQTMLVENFRSMFGEELTYSKNRAVLFHVTEPLPEAMIMVCTRMALRYHLDKRA